MILALVHALFWHLVVVWWLPRHMRRFIDNMKAKDRYLGVQFAAFKKGCGFEEHERHIVSDIVVYFNCVFAQHAVGALLCVPSLLASSPSPVASALACHGALAEVGWEIQDTLVRAKQIVCDGKAGRKHNPVKMVVFLLMHHVLAQCLVLPMNVCYHDCRLYHEAVFVLQGVAVVSLVCQHFGYTCNSDDYAELLQLRVATAASLIIMFWSRIIHSTYLWYAMLTMIHADERMLLFKVAVIPIISMTLFNFMMVADCFSKFRKFALQAPSAEDQSDVKEKSANPTLLGHVVSCGGMPREKKAD